MTLTPTTSTTVTVTIAEHYFIDLRLNDMAISVSHSVTSADGSIGLDRLVGWSVGRLIRENREKEREREREENRYRFWTWMVVRDAAGPGADAILLAGAYMRARRAHPATRISGPRHVRWHRYSQSRKRDKGQEAHSPRSCVLWGRSERSRNFKLDRHAAGAINLLFVAWDFVALTYDFPPGPKYRSFVEGIVVWCFCFK